MTAPPADDDLFALERLAEAGLADPARARRMLLGLAGQGVTDDDVAELAPLLLAALRESPDPDRALASFDRWFGGLPNRYTHFQYLLRHPTALRIFFSVCGVSQLFSDILIRSPEYFEILANPGVRGGSNSAAATYRNLSSFVDGIQRAELKLEAMRHFRQRELLRIGTRDILGLADVPATTREFSHLADACVQKCTEIAVAQVMERLPSCRGLSFAVVAMGKLGGQELNYSSDIDLLFVCGDPPQGCSPEEARAALDAAHRVAELVVSGLTHKGANGHLFRVDVRLRPEGRFGALVRTLASYAAYYESWGEPWEQQALLKARPVAGDPALGAAFAEMACRFVYRRDVSPALVEAVRHNKQRIERKAELEGQSRWNVKVGWGGIRDVEFAVQLLQLIRGGRNPRVRTPNTLDALARLRHAEVLSAAEAADLADDYIFLRNVEHRLQILYELQTQTVPSDAAERRLLARRLGFADAPAFDLEYARRTARIRAHFTAIFLAEPRGGAGAVDDAMGDLVRHLELPEARAELSQHLGERGFRDPDRAVARLQASTVASNYGRALPELVEALARVFGRLVAACARTGAPDVALDGVEALTAAAPNPAELYDALEQSDDLVERFCTLAAGAPPLVQYLTRKPEWLDMLVGEEIADPVAKTAAECRADLKARGLLPDDRRPSRSLDDAAFRDGLAAYVQRERLRAAARELWGEIGAPVAARELTAMADAVMDALVIRGQQRLSASSPEQHAALTSVAVLGLGKLGGGELGYLSDWDIAFAYDGDGPDAQAAVEDLAEWLLAEAQELRVRDAPVQVDARLRPEGRFGALARTVNDLAAYWTGPAQTWERQALTKLRHVGGCAATGARVVATAHRAIYSAPLTADQVEEIRRMKRRIEAERMKPDERLSDIKLGHGGLADIEFTTQLWQLSVGCDHPAVRATGTVEALHALGAAGVIPAPDASRLAENHRALIALRNRLALQGGLRTDVLTAERARLEPIAIELGVVSRDGRAAADGLLAQTEAMLLETRAVVERLLYGAPRRT